MSLFAFDGTGAGGWSCWTRGHMTANTRQRDHSEPIAAIFSGLAARPRQQTLQEKKEKKQNTFYIPQIFMHISQYTFIIILINTKKQHRDSKRKQWVIKRH